MRSVLAARRPAYDFGREGARRSVAARCWPFTLAAASTAAASAAASLFALSRSAAASLSAALALELGGASRQISCHSSLIPVQKCDESIGSRLEVGGGGGDGGGEGLSLSGKAAPPSTSPGAGPLPS